MKRPLSVLAGLVVVMCVFLTSKRACCQILNPANGHFYSVVAVPGGLTWKQAEAAARNMTFGGVQGHLATVTSNAEQQLS
ncbi:MAG TPA: hypothetical protein VF681_16020 [Abditibacteriaceae bacterium]|jgi:hypothetical protein